VIPNYIFGQPVDLYACRLLLWAPWRVGTYIFEKVTLPPLWHDVVEGADRFAPGSVLDIAGGNGVRHELRRAGSLRPLSSAPTTPLDGRRW